MPIVFVFFLLLGLLGLRALFFYYADFQLYESLLCTQHTSTLMCEQQLREKLQSLISFPHMTTVNLQSSRWQVHGKVHIRFSPIVGVPRTDIVLEKKLKLPLQE